MPKRQPWADEPFEDDPEEGDVYADKFGKEGEKGTTEDGANADDGRRPEHQPERAELQALLQTQIQFQKGLEKQGQGAGNAAYDAALCEVGRIKKELAAKAPKPSCNTLRNAQKKLAKAEEARRRIEEQRKSKVEELERTVRELDAKLREANVHVQVRRREVRRIEHRIGGGDASRCEKRAISTTNDHLSDLGTQLHNVQPVLDSLLERIASSGDSEAAAMANAVKSNLTNVVGIAEAAAMVANRVGDGGISTEGDDSDDDEDDHSDQDTDLGEEDGTARYAGGSLEGEITMGEEKGQGQKTLRADDGEREEGRAPTRRRCQETQDEGTGEAAKGSDEASAAPRAPRGAAASSGPRPGRPRDSDAGGRTATEQQSQPPSLPKPPGARKNGRKKQQETETTGSADEL